MHLTVSPGLARPLDRTTVHSLNLLRRLAMTPVGAWLRIARFWCSQNPGSLLPYPRSLLSARPRFRATLGTPGFGGFPHFDRVAAFSKTPLAPDWDRSGPLEVQPVFPRAVSRCAGRSAFAPCIQGDERQRQADRTREEEDELVYPPFRDILGFFGPRG